MTKCNHTHTVKYGKRTYATGIYQMRRCNDCGYCFKGEKIGEVRT